MLTACDFGEVAFFDLPEPTSVHVDFAVVADDIEAAGRLDWAESRVPAADVRLVSGSGQVLEGRTDPAGNLTLDDVPVGSYTIEVSRLLTVEERARMGELGVVAFIHRAALAVLPSTDAIQVDVPASRMRSLVISEIRGQADLTTAGTCCYNFGKYIELYNNADTLIYLDGKVVGMAFSILYDLSPNRPCSLFNHLRVDPAGIWAVEFDRFPGTGRDYPLEPGATAVIAIDAIDHSEFTPDAPNLNSADFELRGNADVDNPAVPDMIQIGLMASPTGHGLAIRTGVVFVAEPVVTENLARAREPDTGREWARIPAESILDLAVQFDASDPTFPACPTLIHPSFDRSRVQPFSEREPGLTLQRKPLLRLPDGRVVLQHTRSSFADFTGGPRTIGHLPPGL